MSDSTPESVIAVHMPYDWCGGMWECVASDCGFDSSDSGTPSADFATHVLEALAAHRMTVVTLPEVAGPDEMGSYRVPVDADGYIRVEPEDQWGDPVISPLMVGLPLRDLAKARRYAAALLAATDVVEESR